MEKSELQRRGERRLPPSPKVAPRLVFQHGKDDCLLTSLPQTSISSSNSSDNDDDSMVYLLFKCRGVTPDFLLFCHPGEKQWRKHEFELYQSSEAMLYLKSKLHVMCWNGVYLEIEIQRGSDIDDEETLAVSKVFVRLDSLPGGCAFRRYYVESFGEIFRIFVLLGLRLGIFKRLCVLYTVRRNELVQI
ncbi:hypothetical protein MKW98_032242 [Papaver atlanticum]|uniref:KIB1-4 beta-propeller domain-containing protein n=1 Tax=Papaver atlanticum TaxID=357466 RepID=A0AAD4XE95_9MAGN|nr:hypothetical protein MKW98_032242 [Papaver atlanticum]